MADLSILIPARNEMFLQRTIEDILEHARADTEVIVILDGQWPDPPINDHPRLRVTHSATVIGQRAATNLAASMSRAPYVMKLDAHCSLDEGFDAKLIAADRELGRPDVTQIPAMYNLHAFNWRCGACGIETYQGPTPTTCAACEAKGAVGGPFDRVIYWDRRANGTRGREVRSEFWRFDQELHFQYWHGYKDRPAARGDLADTMSSIGACFFMRRERFLELGGLDEAHGSWGQFGTEIACKSWLSGGRHIVNKQTWFAHLFRTQGGDFGMPYPNPESRVRIAREYSRKLWIEGTWPGARYPLSWLLAKFAPVPDWTQETIDALPGTRVAAAAVVDRLHQKVDTVHARAVDAPPGPRPSETDQDWVDLTKGLAYYTDKRGDPRLLEAVRRQLAIAAGRLPIVAATLGRLDFGWNLVPRSCVACGYRAWDARRRRICPSCGSGAGFETLKRGYLTMFRQQLAALEALDTDVAFMTEHDVLYHPSHFDFTPPRDDTFYYNQNTYRVEAGTGQTVFYLCSQVSGLCASRALLVEHYRKRVTHVELHGYDRNLGFEPGTNARTRAIDDHPVETWMSPLPNVDIKTEFCLTPGRWNPAEFRNKNSCLGWQVADEIPGWGRATGRFDAFLADVANGVLNKETAA